MKIDFGLSSGRAIISIGLILNNGHNPDFNKSVLSSSLSNFEKSFAWVFSWVKFPSEFIVTANILLFSPLIILSTTPLAGDTNITTSLYLSQKTGLPHFTKSPSLTSNFGVKLGKS